MNHKRRRGGEVRQKRRKHKVMRKKGSTRRGRCQAQDGRGGRKRGREHGERESMERERERDKRG